MTFLSFQDALESLKQRAELVITENETLFDQLKTQAITQVLSADKQFNFEVQTVCVYVNWFVQWNYKINRIYNKILDRDWFSARLFVT